MTPDGSRAGLPSSWTDREQLGSIDPFGPDPDDAVLLAAVAEGRDVQAAMTVLYGRYADAVGVVCANQLRTDRASVEDLVQDVFVLLQRHAEGITDPERLIRWLRKTAANACVNHRLRACNRREVAVLAVPEVATPADHFTDAVAHADQVQRLLSGLSVKSAALLEAHYLRGMTYAEIAEWLGSTAGSIKSQMSEIRKEARRLVQTGKAMIPLPVLEWWGRAAELLKTAGGAPATAAAVLVPVLAVGLLGIPAVGGDVADSPAGRPETHIDDQAGGEQPPAPASQAQDGTGQTRATTAALAASSMPAEPAPGGSAYQRPSPSPVQAVDVPVVGEVQTYEEPTTEPDSRIAVATEQTGELVFLEAHDEPATEQSINAACASATGVDAVTCGP